MSLICIYVLHNPFKDPKAQNHVDYNPSIKLCEHVEYSYAIQLFFISKDIFHAKKQ